MVKDNFTYTFISCDIIVWNGIIARYGNIDKHMIPGDLIRLADDQEKETFKEMQRNGR